VDLRRFRAVSIYVTLQIDDFEAQLMAEIKIPIDYIHFLLAIEDCQDTFGGWPGMASLLTMLSLE
jgi:hypothetical protein